MQIKEIPASLEHTSSEKTQGKQIMKTKNIFLFILYFLNQYILYNHFPFLNMIGVLYR